MDTRSRTGSSATRRVASTAQVCSRSAHARTACTWVGKPGAQGRNPQEGDRRDSLLNWPTDIGFAPDGRAYIVDWNNHEVRRVETDDTLHTVIGNAVEAEGAPDGADYL